MTKKPSCIVENTPSNDPIIHPAMDDRIDHVAQILLSSHDVKKPIGLLTDISIAGVILMLAAIKAGFQVALCHRRDPPEQIALWLDSIRIRGLLASADDELATIIPVKNKILIPTMKQSQKPRGHCFWSEGIASFVSIIKTSGTTSKPKAAVIKGAAHWASAMSVIEYFAFAERSTWALTLPLFHVSGLSILFRTIASGGKIYVARRPHELMSAMQAGHITHASLVPMQLHQLIKANLPTPNLKAVLVGGDRIPEQLISDGLSQQLPLFGSYGMTETASIVVAHDYRLNKSTILPHAEILVDEHQELHVRASSLLTGYLHGESLLLPVDGHGFFATGDYGHFSGCRLHITGRKSLRIISGGENIQLEEVEAAIEQDPSVLRCVATGVKDATYGQMVRAIVKWQGGVEEADELLGRLKQILPHYKIPKEVLPWPPHISPEGKDARQQVQKYYQNLHPETLT